jgi:hypothetical protein
MYNIHENRISKSFRRSLSFTKVQPPGVELSEPNAISEIGYSYRDIGGGLDRSTLPSLMAK